MARDQHSSSSARALRRRTWIVGVAGVAATLLSCRRAPADPVDALLEELESAAEDRDAERLSARLAPGFQGQGRLSREEAVAQLRRYLAAYESVGLSIYGVEADRSPSGATIRCVVELSGEVRSLGGLRGLLPPSAVYRFSLEAAGEPDSSGAWTVRSATWERVGADEAP